MRNKLGVGILLLALGFTGLGCNESPLNPNLQDPAGTPASKTIQIFLRGEKEPLSILSNRHLGDVIYLEAREEGLASAPQWWSADPQAIQFVNEGELHIRGTGRFLIGAVTEEAASYIMVEALPAPSSGSPSGSNPPPEGNSGDPSGNPTPHDPHNPPSDRPPLVPSDPFVDEVVSFHPGPHAGFGADRFPQVVLGPPKGGGLLSGGTDVLSLGIGGEIVLKSDTPILNGDGVDFIVFENAFYAGGNPHAPFAEPGEVAVSQDGVHFVVFPCHAEDSADLYPGCAGVHPVLANSETNTIDPTDPAVAGGDGFDLATVGLDWALYIRIRDLSTGGGGTSAGFDLDAVSIVHQ